MLAAVAALGLFALGSASASATTVLRLDPGPVAFSASKVKNTTSGAATLSLGAAGTIDCTIVEWEINVFSNSSLMYILAILVTLDFTSCTDSLQVITIESCSLAAGTTPSVAILATSTSGGTVTITDARVRCFIAGSGGASFCEYTMATAAGTATNSPSAIAFSSVAVNHVTGASGDQGALCGASGSFSTTLNHIVQSGTNRTVTLSTS
jgi:hypothetical protein